MIVSLEVPGTNLAAAWYYFFCAYTYVSQLLEYKGYEWQLPKKLLVNVAYNIFFKNDQYMNKNFSE